MRRRTIVPWWSSLRAARDKPVNSAVQTLERALQVTRPSSRAHLCSRMPTHSSTTIRKPRSTPSAPRSTVPKMQRRRERCFAQILAAEGNREGAKQEFEAVARDFQTHSAPPSAKQGLQRLYNPDARETLELPASRRLSAAKPLTAGRALSQCQQVVASQCGHVRAGSRAGLSCSAECRAENQSKHKPAA